jgi:hypothetical protein
MGSIQDTMSYTTMNTKMETCGQNGLSSTKMDEGISKMSYSTTNMNAHSLTQNLYTLTSSAMDKMIANDPSVPELLAKLEKFVRDVRIQYYTHPALTSPTTPPPAPLVSLAPPPPTSSAPAPLTSPPPAPAKDKDWYEKAQAKEEKKRQEHLKRLEKVEEVEFERSYIRRAKSLVSKQDWLEENAEGVPEGSHTALWVRFLELMGASTVSHNSKYAVVQLEDNDEDDDDEVFEVNEQDEYPDMEELLSEFKITTCELCEEDLDLEAKTLEEHLWEKTTYLCPHCEDLLENKHKKLITFLSFKTKTDS